MPTIAELSQAHKIPVRHLRKLADLRLLNCEIEKPKPLDEILATLKKGNPLSAFQLLSLIREPGRLNGLPLEYSDAAKIQIRLLGDIERDAFNPERGAHNIITEASAGDPVALREFGEWLASVIPEDGCGYSYLAVRALASVDARFLELVKSRVSKAVLKARSHPALAGMSETENRKTRFFRRAVENFDL